MVVFDKQLRALREERGLTQAEVAEQAGVSKFTVAHWEGGRPPEVGMAARVARAFGVTLDWLITGTGPKKRKV